MLLVGRDVQYSCPGFSEFDGELCPAWSELNGRIETTTVTTIIIFITAIHSHVQGGLVVIQDGDGHVYVCPISVIDATVEEVSVKIFRFRVEFEVLVAELPSTKAQ